MLRRQGLGVVADGRSRHMLEETAWAWKSRIRSKGRDWGGGAGTGSGV